MRRRQVLSALAFTSTSLTGCTAPGARGTDDRTSPTGTDTETWTATSEPGPDATESLATELTSTAVVTPDPDDPIAVVLQNTTEQERTVEVAITHAQETVFEKTATVAAGGLQEFDTGIAETGDYELSVSVTDGPETTVPLDIDTYDLRYGSNLLVELDTDDILILIEE